MKEKTNVLFVFISSRFAMEQILWIRSIDTPKKRNNGNSIDLVKFEQIELKIQFRGGSIESKRKIICTRKIRERKFSGRNLCSTKFRRICLTSNDIYPKSIGLKISRRRRDFVVMFLEGHRIEGVTLKSADPEGVSHLFTRG